MSPFIALITAACIYCLWIWWSAYWSATHSNNPGGFFAPLVILSYIGLHSRKKSLLMGFLWILSPISVPLLWLLLMLGLYIYERPN